MLYVLQTEVARETLYWRGRVPRRLPNEIGTGQVGNWTENIAHSSFFPTREEAEKDREYMIMLHSEFEYCILEVREEEIFKTILKGA